MYTDCLIMFLIIHQIFSFVNSFEDKKNKNTGVIYRKKQWGRMSSAPLF